MILSWFASSEVFNSCTHNNDRFKMRQISIRIISVFLGPIMPAIILANYIFYREQEYDYKRQLQSHGCIEYDLGNDESLEAEQMLEEQRREKDSDPVKVSLFRKIQKLRYRAALNRRYYSYYRYAFDI